MCFWWKASTAFQITRHCYPSTRLQPLSPTTWTAIKSLGLLRRTRGKRGGQHLNRDTSSISTAEEMISINRTLPLIPTEAEHLPTNELNYVNNGNNLPTPLLATDNTDYSSHESSRDHVQSGSTGRDIRRNIRRKSLHFACVNARSVRNKVADVVDHVVGKNIDICVVTETWLKDHDTVSIAGLSPNGYAFKSFPRQSERNGGGTGIMFKDSLNVNMIDGKENRSFEFSEWRVGVHNYIIKVVSIYRPPYSDRHPISPNVFMDEFSQYLENIVMAPEILLITGDFNFHLDCPSDNDAKKFSDLLETFGLVQHVNVPTHTSGHILDLIITRSNNDIIISSPCTSLVLSDHSFVECKLDIPRPNLYVGEVHFRKLKEIDIETFKADISASELCNSTWSNATELAECYDNTLSTVLNKHAPMMTKTMVVRPRVPWFNNTLRLLKAKRRKMERKMLKTGLPDDRKAYYVIRDNYSTLLNDAKRAHYSDLIEQCAGDSRKLFSVVNSLCNDRSCYPLPPHEDPRHLANDFGEFFCKKIELIQEEIDNIVIEPPQVEYRLPDAKLMDFSLLTEEYMRHIIISSSNATCKLDPIPTWLLKQCCDILAPVITRLVNLSLGEGLVPKPWKTALVSPLLKKHGLDPTFKNFRPVSNLPFVAKSAEKAVIAQLFEHCTANCLLPENQSSYRKFHSTETALLKVQSDILTSMDKQEVTLLILLDLSAAFDTINHSILLDILEYDFGIVGLVKDWITSFLSERQQHVVVKTHKSDAFDLNSGVPQGSCLGPVLFLLYASGLFKIVSKHLPNAHCYADDTQLYLSFKPGSQTSQETAVKVIQECVVEVRAWMVSHRLLINDGKTEFLIIGSRQQLSKVNIESVTVGESTIKPVESVRNLGVWFDHHMSMNDHVGKVCSKSFRSLYNIRQIRKFLSEDSTKTLVHAFVTSHLDYCNSLFYGIPQYQFNRLQRVLNAAARVVCLIPKYSHITPVMKTLHWLPVKYRVTFKVVLLVFKALHGIAPSYLSDLLKFKPKGRYCLRTDDQLLLTVPRTNCKTFGDRAFFKVGPSLWNNLPLNIRQLTKLETFKNHLKTYLFKLAYAT